MGSSFPKPPHGQRKQERQKREGEGQPGWPPASGLRPPLGRRSAGRWRPAVAAVTDEEETESGLGLGPKQREESMHRLRSESTNGRGLTGSRRKWRISAGGGSVRCQAAAATLEPKEMGLRTGGGCEGDPGGAWSGGYTGRRRGGGKEEEEEEELGMP